MKYQRARSVPEDSPAIRTYRQVAEALARREGAPKPISAVRVQQICAAAERKIAKSLDMMGGERGRA